MLWPYNATPISKPPNVLTPMARCRNSHSGTTGSGAPRYTSFTNGMSPIWNKYGHERMGWAISTAGNPAAP